MRKKKLKEEHIYNFLCSLPVKRIITEKYHKEFFTLVGKIVNLNVHSSKYKDDLKTFLFQTKVTRKKKV